MSSALIDEGGPVPCNAVQLAAVGLPALGQLVGAVAHALLPLAGLEAPPMILQSVEDIVDPTSATEVRGEPRQPVIDHVCVRVVEAGEDGGAFELDDASRRPAQLHDLTSAATEDLAAGDREVAVRIQPGPSERADSPARQDHFRFHSARLD